MVGDSYCWNCADFNLHLGYPVCSSTPKSIEAVMSYSYGPTAEFLHFMENSNEEYISACNSDILHGTLGTGFNPKVILRAQTASVVFKGVGYLCSLREASKCGCSLDFTGLMMASFPLEYNDLD